MYFIIFFMKKKRSMQHSQKPIVQLLT